MRQILLYPGEDNYWIAEVPSLPGALSQGQTREEAIALIEEVMREAGDRIPEDRLEAELVTV